MASQGSDVSSREGLLAAIRDRAPLVDAQGRPRTFQDADLSGADLARVVLRGADLRGVCLSGADLSGADLSGADLSGADLSGATLRSVHLISADLRGAVLTGAVLADANLYRARLHDAVLTRADLTGAGLNEGQLERADLSEANLQDSKLIRANLRGARLSGARMSRAYLSEAILAGALLVDAELCEANLSGADLEGVDLRGADLRKTNLEGCQGTPVARGNASLSASTYRHSGWQSADIVEWLQAGSVLVDPENLPQLEHQHLFAVQLGLILKFHVHLRATDWLALYALITVLRARHPHANLRVVAFHETQAVTTVRILADDRDAMARLAELLAGRIWEQPLDPRTPESDLVDALVMTVPRIREHLSWLVDRGRVFELYVIENSALQKTRQWVVEVDRRMVLARLLEQLMAPAALGDWLKTLTGKPTARLSGLQAVDVLEGQGTISPAMFSELLLTFPESAQDLLFVARLWSVTVSARHSRRFV